MPLLLKNNAFSLLASSLTDTSTSLTVTSGHGSRFPVVAGADYFKATIQDASNNIEVIKVTARASGSDTMTIERGQEGTTARAWGIGDLIELRITAGVLNPLAIFSEASSAAAMRSAIGAFADSGGAISGSVSITGNLSYTGTFTGGTGVINIGSGQFYKDASGFFGFGTNSPQFKMDCLISSTTSFSGSQDLVGSTNKNILGYSIRNIGSSSNGIEAGILLEAGLAQSTQWGIYAQKTADDLGALIVRTKTGALTSAEILRLTSGGNLGIGTATPSTRLHVFATGTTGIGIFQSNQSASLVNFVCTGQTSGQPQIGAEGSNLIFNLNGGTRIRVLPDGNLFQNVASFSTQAGSTGIFNPSGGGVYSVNGLQQRLSHNCYLAASGNATYQKSDFACEYRLSEGVGSHSWFTAASGTAGATIAFGGPKMFLSNAGHLKSSNSGSYGGSGTGDLTASACHLFQNDQNNGVLRLISTNAGSSATTLETYLPTGAAGNHFTGRVNNAASIQILANGNILNANNSYGALSDERIKENPLPAKSYLDRYMQVQYKTYNRVGQTHREFGVIAQELEKVFPGLVEEVHVFDKKGKATGEMMKSVKYSILAQIQGKVIQEQQVIIEKIAERLGSLEQLVTSSR